MIEAVSACGDSFTEKFTILTVGEYVEIWCF